jgi:lambda family phage tail tape measure protein
MAIAGDVIIKLAADFADFSRGMDESQQKLVTFGEQTTATAQKLEALAETAKKVVESLAVMWVVDKVLAFGKALEDTAQSIITQSKALQLSTDAFQAYSLSASKAGIEQQTLVTGLERFNAVSGNAVLGNAAAIKTFNDLGVKLLDVNGNLRSNEDRLTEAAQKLLAMKDGATKAALEVQLFGRSGQELNGILQDLAKGQAALVAQNQKLIFPPEVLAQLAEFKTRSDEALRSIQVIAAPWWIELKTDVLEFVARALKSMSDSFVILNSNVGWIDKLHALGNIGTLGGAGAATGDDQLTGLTNRINQLGDTYEKLQQQIRNANNPDVSGLRVGQAQIDAWKKEAETTRQEIVKVQDAYAQLKAAHDKANAPLPTLPAVIVPGVSQPTSTADQKKAEDLAKQLQAQIDKYTAMGVAADKAYNTIATGQDKTVEDIKRQITVQQQADDIFAKLGPKYAEAHEAERKQLEDAINLYEQKKDREQKALEVTQAGLETQKKYGDGTAALTKLTKDLNDQLNLHRINQTDYNRALKEGTEAINQSALAAQRYDDNLGSLAAGFEHAANAYARSNDLYSQGEQVFTGLTTAMTDGLQALEGQSTKTFAQIALDFANMLAQMALKAAVSQVFQTLFGPVTAASAPGFANVAGINSANVAAGLPAIPGLQHGGPVSPGQPYVVGETGPELFVPTAAGNIVPSGAAGGGGSNITVNVAMGTAQGATDPATAMAFGRRMQAAIKDVISNERRPGGTLYSRITA